jgi:hypothetical protein
MRFGRKDKSKQASRAGKEPQPAKKKLDLQVPKLSV